MRNRWFWTGLLSMAMAGVRAEALTYKRLYEGLPDFDQQPPLAQLSNDSLSALWSDFDAAQRQDCRQQPLDAAYEICPRAARPALDSLQSMAPEFKGEPPAGFFADWERALPL